MTATFFPQIGGGGGNITTDGRAYISGADESFSALRADNGVFSDATGANADIAILQSRADTDGFGTLVRGFFTFNTSSLGGYAIITSATISFFLTNLANGLGSPALHVAGATLANVNNIVSADYQNAPLRTSFGNLPYASAVTGQYNDIALNQAGINSINLFGISQFSAQLEWDINNNFTGTWSANNGSTYGGNFSDNGSNQPKLTVNYVINTSQVQGRAPQPLTLVQIVGN